MQQCKGLYGFSRNAIVRTKFDIYVFIIVDEHELAVGGRLVAMHHMGVDISREITSTDWLVWEYWYQNEQYSIESVCDNYRRDIRIYMYVIFIYAIIGKQ
jgi:hypothetical protein